MTILVIGHWASCNLGDRYQPFVVYRALREQRPDEKLVPVNFSGTRADKLSFSIGCIDMRIATPPEIDVLDSIDGAIITTGSMDAGSPYVGWLSALLSARSEMRFLIVWGGFSRGYQPFDVWRRGLEFLGDPRVMCFARSALDLDLYRALGCARSRLGGDPIAWWASVNAADFLSTVGIDRPGHRDRKWSVPVLHESQPTHPSGSKRPSTSVRTQSVVVVCSMHCFEYERAPFWQRLTGAADTVLCIDSHADARIQNTVLVPTPWEFLDAIAGADHVISARLHGGVLAACSGTPTTLVAVDEPKLGHGSLKFQAVATTAVGQDQSQDRHEDRKEWTESGAIAQFVIPSPSISAADIFSVPGNWAVMHENAQHYIQLTLESLAFLSNEILVTTKHKV